MNERIKSLWVEALESGEYPQARGELRNGAGFCCLGVLCDVYAKDTGDGKWEEEPGSHNKSHMIVLESGCREGVYLPVEVSKWADINEFGHIDAKNRKTTINLAAMNDNGSTFKEIAQVIKENL